MTTRMTGIILCDMLSDLGYEALLTAGNPRRKPLALFDKVAPHVLASLIGMMARHRTVCNWHAPSESNRPGAPGVLHHDGCRRNRTLGQYRPSAYDPGQSMIFYQQNPRRRRGKLKSPFYPRWPPRLVAPPQCPHEQVPRGSRPLTAELARVANGGLSRGRTVMSLATRSPYGVPWRTLPRALCAARCRSQWVNAVLLVQDPRTTVSASQVIAGSEFPDQWNHRGEILRDTTGPGIGRACGDGWGFLSVVGELHTKNALSDLGRFHGAGRSTPAGHPPGADVFRTNIGLSAWMTHRRPSVARRWRRRVCHCGGTEQVRAGLLPSHLRPTFSTRAGVGAGSRLSSVSSGTIASAANQRRLFAMGQDGRFRGGLGREPPIRTPS